MSDMELSLYNETGHNRYLFANYYLENYLKETEAWKISDQESAEVLAAIRKLEKPKEGAKESQTENKWIRPILDLLGHHYNVNVSINTPLNYKAPDYIFYPNEDTRKSQENLNYKEVTLKEKALAVGEAKAWARNLDRQLKEETVFQGKVSQNPTYQIDFYIRHTELDWGILTNGKQWRLYHKDSSRKLDVYYWVDLEKIIHSDNSEDNFKYFYLFFRKEAFIKGGFLDSILRESRQHAENVGESLNEQVFRALEILMEGFLNFPYNQLDPTPKNLERVRKNSLIYLYRLLFVLYAESRNLLSERKYLKHFSLRALQEKLKLYNNGCFLKSKSVIWWQLQELWRVINSGNEEIGFKAYNGGLFDPIRHSFLEENKVGDLYLAQVIEKLAYINDKERNIFGFIDYSDLDIRHLGSIYEGLLEYQPEKVWDEENSEYNIHLVNEKGERKVTGSYYTPDFIVKYIVEQAVKPVLDRIVEEQNGLDETLMEKILSVKVLDPAMGSGHFLVEVTDFVANYLVGLEFKPQELREMEKSNNAETVELSYWRRKVVQSCIYGVDINPLAVELAKLALWLSTVSKDKPLNFLNHHLRCGNSLVGARMGELKAPKPKVEEQEEWLFEKRELDTVAHQASQAVAKIEHKEIKTLRDAQEVESIYEKEVRPTLEKYRKLANLWTAQHFGLKIDAQILRSLSDYILKNIEQLKNPEKYLGEARKIAQKYNFFHWELEFPEVFFEREEKGFDVVVGNPPYVRQEILGQELKSFLIPKFYNVGNGIADLYVYFYELGMSNLRDGGYLSFITPNKWMERKYGAELRKFLKKYWILRIVNYSELKIFEEAATEPAIMLLRKIISDEDIEYLSVKSLAQAKKFEDYQYNAYPKSILQQRVWRFAGSLVLSILEKFRKDSVTLSEYTDNGIYYGIKTALNQVFIIDKETRDKIVAKDPNSAEILKPMVEGDDFGKWHLSHSGRYMVATEYDLDLPNLYPTVYEYLKQYEEKLRKRQDQGQNWWNLRACTYYEEFDKPKIIYYHTALEHNFYLDTEGYYISANCYMIANGDTYLQCILNSSLFQFVKRYLFPAFGDAENGGRIRLDANKMIHLPIKNISQAEKQPFQEIAQKISSQSKELQNLKNNFSKYIKNRFSLKKITKKLENWYELDWKGFLRELKKSGGKLKSKEEFDLMEFFEEKREEAQKIKQEIETTDKKIDEMVYQLYGLTEEEIEALGKS